MLIHWVLTFFWTQKKSSVYKPNKILKIFTALEFAS
jgi:hypothetical protein